MQLIHLFIIEILTPRICSLYRRKGKLNSYLLRFERYTENAKWEKNRWAIKLIALLTGRAMDAYTRMSNIDTNDNDRLNSARFSQKVVSGKKPPTSKNLAAHLEILPLTPKKFSGKNCHQELKI